MPMAVWWSAGRSRPFPWAVGAPSPEMHLRLFGPGPSRARPRLTTITGTSATDYRPER